MTIENKIKHYYAYLFLRNLHFFGAVLVPFFTVWGGITEQTVLLIQSWFMIWITILELPTGIVADRFGRKTSLLAGSLMAIAGLTVYGLYPHLYLFLIGELLLALSMTFFSGADEAWLIDTLNQHGWQKRRTEIIGKGQSFMYSGMILATVAGSQIAQHISLNATMYLSAIPALLMLIVLWRMPEPKVDHVEDEVFQWRKAFGSIKFLIGHPQLRILSLNVILVAVATYFVIWLYQPLLLNAGVSVGWFGFFHAGLIGIQIIISQNLGWFEKKLGPAGYLQLSVLITFAGFMLLWWQRNVVTIVLFLITAGGFGLTRRNFAISHFHEFVDSQYRASISSSFSLLMRLSMGLANIGVGWLFVRSESSTLLLLGLLPLAAVLLVPTKSVFKQE